MKFEQCDDIKLLIEMCRQSGDEITKKESSFLSSAKFMWKKDFFAETLDDIGFYAGGFGKNHFRLVECVVVEAYQKQGFGRVIVDRMKKKVKEAGKTKITLRTYSLGKAVDFWQKMGAEIVGYKGDDFVMEIRL